MQDPLPIKQDFLRALGQQALRELAAQFLCVREGAGCFAAKKRTAIGIGDNAEKSQPVIFGDTSRSHRNVATAAESIQERTLRHDFNKSNRVMQERQLPANRVMLPCF